MGSVRRIWMENDKGDILDLTDNTKGYFLHSPDGMGFEKEIQTLEVGNSEQVIASKTKIPNPTGEIVFFGDTAQGYENYNKIALFMQQEPSKYCYQPPNVTYSYYIDCKIRKFGKSEFKEDGSMRCALEVKGLSYWKKNDASGKGKELIVSNTYDSSKGKYYPLVRPYAYRGLSLRDIKINNQGSSPVGFEYEVNGYVENPELRVYKNGKQYGEIKINGEYDVVRVKSIDGEQEIYLEKDGEPVTNPDQKQDFEPLPDGVIRTFFKLKLGESKFVFDCDNFTDFDGLVIFRWEDTFLGV